MLVLSRQRSEKIILGDGEKRIVFTIVDIRADKVRIGVEAPDDVSIHREEVYDELKAVGKNLLTRAPDSP